MSLSLRIPPHSAVFLRHTLPSLLLSHNLPPTAHILHPSNEPPLLPHPSTHTHSLPNATLPAAASRALHLKCRHLLLPHTTLHASAAALNPDWTRRPPLSGLEMLPSTVIRVHTPLMRFGADALDEAAAALPEHVRARFRGFVDSRRHLLGDVSEAGLLAHAETKREAVEALQALSDALIRAVVVDASHWGYLLIDRTTLTSAYRANKILALNALSRMIAHVSGGSTHPSPLDMHLCRLADALLSPRPMPKGRTVGGVVLRPATGRFARRRRSGGEWKDLMMIIREPDHENGTLYTRRLQGNASCQPLFFHRPVYWDNRFVMSLGPIDNTPPLNGEAVLQAALKGESTKHDLTNATFYVRQLRKADWENILSGTARVRQFQVPFECIRALPGVYEKKPGSSEHGELVACPHLGVATRTDLYFTAVRMPRFRSLPPDICPGFVEGAWHEDVA